MLASFLATLSGMKRGRPGSVFYLERSICPSPSMRRFVSFVISLTIPHRPVRRSRDRG